MSFIAHLKNKRYIIDGIKFVVVCVTLVCVIAVTVIALVRR